MWHFRSPQIVFGEDALGYLEQIQGRQAFLVTDATLAGLGLTRLVEARLATAGIPVTVFADVEPEPALATVLRGAEAMRAVAPDWIIGFGGGSVLDSAKAMRILYERPDLSPDAINPFEPLGLSQGIHLILIPTTAGTGSEVTAGAVLTDHAAQRKLEVASYEAIADVALVDPAITAAMPRALTADTGMDVLTHSVEGYAGTWANDFSDGLCLQATRLVFDYLPRAVAHGAADPEAREKMANAATIAGLGMTNSHIALAHALGHAAGALFHIPHGRVTGLLLPYTVEFTARGGAGRYLDLARVIGLSVQTEAEAGPALAVALRDLLRRIGQPESLAACGVTRAQLDAHLEALCDRAEMDASMVTARRIPDRAEMRRLFDDAFKGRGVDY